jgi:hypothetical protein
MRPSTGTYAIVDREGDCKVVVMLVDHEADAQSMAIELRQRGRRADVEPYPQNMHGRIQRTARAVLPASA